MYDGNEMKVADADVPMEGKDTERTVGAGPLESLGSGTGESGPPKTKEQQFDGMDLDEPSSGTEAHILNETHSHKQSGKSHSRDSGRFIHGCA